MSILPRPRLVVVESPYRPSDAYSVEQHKLYLLHALADCYRRGEAPFASHHLGPEVLDDDREYERALGIHCGFAWGQHADLIAVYSDLGMSPGMKAAIQHYKSIGKPIEWRSLPDRIVRAVRAFGETEEMRDETADPSAYCADLPLNGG